MKRLSILFLACFFAVNATASAQLITPSDVPTPIASPFGALTNYWSADYEPALAWAFENDILTGHAETGEIGELECVKRAEILKMLYKALEVQTSNTGELFSDTFSNQWYAPYVRTARQRNTINGYPDGTFRPAQCVNRAEALKIALLEFPNVNPVNSTFDGINDVPASEWYYRYVSYALANDLVGLKHIGYSGMYLPGESMTREEFAEMLYRLKTLQDNKLAQFDDAYGPSNIVVQTVETRDLRPEEYFNYDTTVLVTLNTADKNQLNILNRFLSGTPAGTVEGFVELLFDELASGASDDLLTAFGDNYKIMFAVSESNSLVPRSTLLITVNEPKKISDLFDRLDASPDFHKDTLFGFNTFTSPKNEMYFVYENDALIAWPTFNQRYLALQRIKNGGRSFADNTEYTQYKGTLPTPNVGTIFFDSPTGESGMVAVIPSVEGISFYINYNDHYELNVGTSPYMYKNLPGNDLIAFGESSGFLDYMEEQGTDVIAGMRDSGVDFNGGNWLNQGFAFLMQDTGTLIPGLSLYFDSTGYVGQAEADLATLDSFLEEVIDQMNLQDPELAGFLVKDTTRVDGQTMDRVTMDFSALPQDEMAQLGPFIDFLLQPLEFYYGITSDDYTVFALYAGFDDVLGNVRTISEDLEFKEGMTYLKDYPLGLNYVSVGNFVDYVDMLVDEFERSAEPMPAEYRDIYDDVLDYLEPVKYMIAADKEFDGIGRGLIFVKID